jgi:uncharacterized protein
MSKNLILIFTRNPEIGKCKKRLAATVGDVNALAIYKILLQHTVNITERLDCHKAVYYDSKIEKNDIWQDDNYQKFKQIGSNLGLRMMYAFRNSFRAGYEKVVIIGSDLIDLEPQQINQTFSALDTHDVVIGPAVDGGYYLLGMKEMQTPIFYDKDWGTSTVRADTLSDLYSQKVAMLETLNDIDVYDDLRGHDIFEPYLKRKTEETAIL